MSPLIEGSVVKDTEAMAKASCKCTNNASRNTGQEMQIHTQVMKDRVLSSPRLYWKGIQCN